MTNKKQKIMKLVKECLKDNENILCVVDNEFRTIKAKEFEKCNKKERECERYKQAIEEILELADDNKHTIQYKGICQSILEIINNAKDINVPTKKESE